MEYFIDVSYDSLFHFGEELCGDNVEFIREDNYCILVLADGLGSGVKANILSTLTSKIISTMLKEGATLDEAIETIAKTLPVCHERNIAYSTFTIIRVDKNGHVYMAEFDNPNALHYRDGKLQEIERESRNIDGKEVLISTFQARLGDILIAFSDGVVHAGVGRLLDLGWQYDNAVNFITDSVKKDTSPLALTKNILGAVNTLYMQEPGDDSTVCTLLVKENRPATVMVGPPVDKEKDREVVDRLMHSKGIKVVCGGTTSQSVSKLTGKEVTVSIDYENPAVPPIAHMQGIDLVTEGVLTLGKALEILKKITAEDGSYEPFNLKKNDGATRLARLFLEESTQVDFLVGRALNPAHQNPGMPISLGLKLNLIKELAAEIEKTGKKVTLSYY